MTTADWLGYRTTGWAIRLLRFREGFPARCDDPRVHRFLSSRARTKTAVSKMLKNYDKNSMDWLWLVTTVPWHQSLFTLLLLLSLQICQ